VHNTDIRSGTDDPIFLKLFARLRPYRNVAARLVGTYRRVTLERTRVKSEHACVVAGVPVGRWRSEEDNQISNLGLPFTHKW
jgi:hypothetical protein